MRALLATARLLLAAVPAAALLPLALVTRLIERGGAGRLSRLGLRLAARVQALWAAGELFALGVRLEPPGPVPRGAFLIVSNHVSYVDILVLGRLFPCRFIAKSEIAGWPVVGWLARSVGTIFVDQRERRDVVRVGGEVARALAAGVSVVLFPEGGASSGEAVRDFHPALFAPAARAEAPCLAVALSYAAPRTEYTPRVTVAWWGGMGMAGHLWRLLRLGPVLARPRWASGPVVDADRKRLCRRLEAVVREVFVPLPGGLEPASGPLPDPGLGLPTGPSVGGRGANPGQEPVVPQNPR